MEDQRGNSQMMRNTDESEGSLGGGLLVAPESRPEKPLVFVPPPDSDSVASNDSNPTASAAAEPHSTDIPVEVSQGKKCTLESSVSDNQGSGVTQQESVEEKVSSAAETETVTSETSRSSYKRKKPKKDRSKLRKGKWTVSAISVNYQRAL